MNDERVYDNSIKNVKAASPKGVAFFVNFNHFESVGGANSKINWPLFLLFSDADCGSHSVLSLIILATNNPQQRSFGNYDKLNALFRGNKKNTLPNRQS
jgi:hypothetical protein